MALTQAQLDAMQADRSAGYRNPITGEWISQSKGGYVDPATGQQIGYWNAAGVDDSNGLLTALGFDPNSQYTYGSGKAFDTYSIMDSAGADTGRTGQYADDRGLGREMLMGALMMAGGALAGGAFGGAAAGAGSGGGMVNGAFLGEGALSGIPAWDGALAAAGGAGAAGGGAAMGAGGGGGGGGAIGGASGNGAFLGEGVSSGVPAWDRALKAASTGAGSSLFDKALGVGTSLLGGHLGSQGRNIESTTKEDIPEELKPYIYGENGLLGQAMGQLNASRSPARMAEWDAIRQRGMGLLQQPVAGNPTANWRFGR